MAREDLHFRLRIPEALKEKVEEAAEENRRSMTAEIIARLEESFAQPHRLEQLINTIAEQTEKLNEAKVRTAYLEESRNELEKRLEKAENGQAESVDWLKQEPIFNIVLDAKGHPLDWPTIAAHIHRTAKAAGVESVGFRAAIFDTKKLDDPYDQEYRRLVRWYQDQTRKHKVAIRGEDK